MILNNGITMIVSADPDGLRCLVKGRFQARGLKPESREFRDSKTKEPRNSGLSGLKLFYGPLRNSNIKICDLIVSIDDHSDGEAAYRDLLCAILFELDRSGSAYLG